MNDQNDAPDFDPEDPHHAARVRLHNVVEALRNRKSPATPIDASTADLSEIARMWTTYAPHDLLGSEVEARAREEIERRGESVDGDAE